MGITELVELIRQGLAEDERLARELIAWRDWIVGGDGGPSEFHKLIGDPLSGPFGGQSRIRNFGTGQDIAKLANPVRVLAEAAAKRQLLDLVISWQHDASPSDGICYADTLPAFPCHCGRDERVLQVLQALATPYQETT